MVLYIIKNRQNVTFYFTHIRMTKYEMNIKTGAFKILFLHSAGI
jgi:hypothetical protein